MYRGQYTRRSARLFSGSQNSFLKSPVCLEHFSERLPLARARSGTGQAVENALTPPHHPPHDSANQCAKNYNDRLNRNIQSNEYRVQAQHHEYRQILVEILHRNRVAGGEQYVAAVLQQCVHRNNKESSQYANAEQKQVQYQYRYRQMQRPERDAPFRWEYMA